jgi:hypothetical protein
MKDAEKGKVPLMGAVIEPMKLTDTQYFNCFVIRTPKRNVVLSAASEAEMMEWIVCTCRLARSPARTTLHVH